MNRPISIVAVLQVLVIVLGFITLGIHMKFLGYPTAPEYVMRWSGLALFLRGYGLLFLLVPLLWTALAIFASQSDSGFTYQRTILLGIVALVLMLCTFLYAAMRPGVQPLLIYAPAPASPPQQSGSPTPPNP